MAPRPRKKKRVTITDVALEAKVSIAAVSRILNNNYDGFSAREETKERVLLAAKTLGYRPSRAAISLATGRHNAIALCFPTHELDAQPIAVGSIDQVFRHFEMMLVINGIRRAIEPERLDLIMVPARPEHRTDEFVLSLQDKVDGVLWINPDDEGETLNEIVQAGLALAVVGSAPIAGNFVNVRADEATAGRMGMGHLLVRGAKKLLIAVPTERANEVGIKERIEGAKRAIADYSKKDLDLKVVQLPIEPNRARIIFAEHLDKNGIPDGILTMGGHLPFVILHELYRRNYDVPNDMLLVGFEENPLYMVNSPSITGLRYPTEQMCHEAARLLLEFIDTGEAPGAVWKTPQLIARASCP